MVVVTWRAEILEVLNGEGKWFGVKVIGPRWRREAREEAVAICGRVFINICLFFLVGMDIADEWLIHVKNNKISTVR